MMTLTASHCLLKAGTMYRFTPAADGSVAVALKSERSYDRYTMDTDEARAFYRTLLLRGFRPW